MTNLRGFSLIEVLISLACLSLILFLFSATVNLTVSGNSQDNLVFDLNQAKQNILLTAVNDGAMTKTIADTTNASMSCLRDSVPCQVGVDGGKFNLRDGQNNLIVDSIDGTSGLMQNGNICTGFNAQTYNPGCPLRYVLTWEPQCPNGQSKCLNPLMSISGQLIEVSPQRELASLNEQRFNINIYRDVPSSISSNPTDVEVGLLEICAVMQNGNAKCFGYNAFGELGYGDSVNRGDVANTMGANLPDINFGPGLTVKSIFPGCQQTCALVSDGTIRCMGAGFGPSPVNRFSPPGPVTQLSRGDDEYLMLVNGKAYFFGDDYSLNVHLGANWITVSLPSPGAPLKFTQVSMGRSTFCLLASDGSVRCAGDNDYGESGAGNFQLGGIWGMGLPPADFEPGNPQQVQDWSTYDISNNWKRVKFPGGLTASAVYSGDHFNCAILSDGRAYCWGLDGDGQLGVSPTGNNQGEPIVSKPVQPTTPAGKTVIDMALGELSACAQYSDHTLECWGYGWSGTQPGSPTPHVTMSTILGHAVKTIRAYPEDDQYCSILDDSSVYCWNEDPAHQLLDGWYFTTNSSVPIKSNFFNIPATWYWPDITPAVNWGP